MKRIILSSIIGLCSLLIFQACATVEKDNIGIINEQTPQISKILTEEAPKRFLKRKVAIARFSNETKYGQGFFVDKNNDRIGKQAMDILSSKLGATDKFILLERADIDKINKELKLGNLNTLNIPADYLIIGSVSEFGRKNQSEVGIFSRKKKQSAHAKVNIRLVDIKTGQVTYSEEGEGVAFVEAGTVIGMGDRSGYDSSLNDKAISAAISKMVNDIVENLLDKPWRSFILAKEGDQYIISGGKTQGIMDNDIFNVFKKGKTVKNPQTNMMIELPGSLVGTIRVQQSIGADPNNEVSFCSVENGIIPEKYTDLYIEEIIND